MPGIRRQCFLGTANMFVARQLRAVFVLRPAFGGSVFFGTANMFVARQLRAVFVLSPARVFPAAAAMVFSVASNKKTGRVCCPPGPFSPARRTQRVNRSSRRSETCTVFRKRPAFPGCTCFLNALLFPGVASFPPVVAFVQKSALLSLAFILCFLFLRTILLIYCGRHYPIFR